MKKGGGDQILILHKKHPEQWAWSNYCNNLKRMRESIHLQSNKFTTFKVRDGIEVTKSFMVFNLRNIIHLFQSKKYSRT